jgi:hypothetical protein
VKDLSLIVFSERHQGASDVSGRCARAVQQCGNGV